MDEKRLKIAEKNFKNYLETGMINKVLVEDIVFQTYFNNALESLKVAEELFKNKTSSLWVTVTSYYSMFYIASAYIYNRGYKTKGEIVHQVINEALIILARHALEKHFLEEYEEEKEKALFASGNLLKEYELEKAKNKTLSALVIKNELPMGRLVDLGFNWTYLGQYFTVEDDVNSIKAVTTDEIHLLIEKLKPGKFTQFSIGPAR